MPLSPTVTASDQHPFSQIQLMESSIHPLGVSHSYSAGSLGQMQFPNGFGSFWSPHRGQTTLQSRRSQSREDLSASLAEAHLGKVQPYSVSPPAKTGMDPYNITHHHIRFDSKKYFDFVHYEMFVYCAIFSACLALNPKSFSPRDAGFWVQQEAKMGFKYDDSEKLLRIEAPFGSNRPQQVKHGVNCRARCSTFETSFRILFQCLWVNKVLLLKAGAKF